MSGQRLSASENEAGGVVIDDDFLDGIRSRPNVRVAQFPVKTESNAAGLSDVSAAARKRRPVSPPAERLRQLRRAAGFRSAAAAARAMPNVSDTTYQQHENGQRPLTRAAAAIYAGFFRVPAGFILFGERLQDTPEVPVVGIIGPGGTIQELERGELESTQAPRQTGLAAYRVVARDLWPAYHENDLAFFSPHTLAQPIDAEAVNGHECIVILPDGTRVLRFVTMNGSGTASLIAYSGPPLMNVAIKAAARVLWIKRAD
jgi:hypothetical protein